MAWWRTAVDSQKVGASAPHQPGADYGAYVLRSVLDEGPGGAACEVEDAQGHVMLLKVWTHGAHHHADRTWLESLHDPLRDRGPWLPVRDFGQFQGDWYLVQEPPGPPLSRDPILRRFRLDETEVRVDLFCRIVAAWTAVEAGGWVPGPSTLAQLYEAPGGHIVVDPVGMPYPPPHYRKLLDKRGVQEVQLRPPPIPPEAMTGRPVGARSAVWSLGYMGYELMCGQSPFPGVDVALSAMASILEPAVGIRAHNPRLGGAMERLLQRCLAAPAEFRPATVAEVQGELARIMERR